MKEQEYRKPVLKAYGSLKEQTRVIAYGVGKPDSPKFQAVNKTG